MNKILKNETWKIIVNNAESMTVGDTIRLFRGKGCHMTGTARHILEKMGGIPRMQENELKLVKLSVAELCSKNRAGIRDIILSAKERGLKICPSNIGPRLRIEYKTQPTNELIRVPLLSVTGVGVYNVFGIRSCFGSAWLDGYYDKLSIPFEQKIVAKLWEGTDFFVFTPDMHQEVSLDSIYL